MQEGFFFCLSHPMYHFRSRAADGRMGAMRSVRYAGRRDVLFQKLGAGAEIQCIWGTGGGGKILLLQNRVGEGWVRKPYDSLMH